MKSHVEEKELSGSQQAMLPCLVTCCLLPLRSLFTFLSFIWGIAFCSSNIVENYCQTNKCSFCLQGNSFATCLGPWTLSIGDAIIQENAVIQDWKIV
jgi:hypothetical protein